METFNRIEFSIDFIEHLLGDNAQQFDFVQVLLSQADGNRNKPLFALFFVQHLDDIVDKAGFSRPAVSRNQIRSTVRLVRPQPVAELLISTGRINIFRVGLLFGSGAVEKLEVFHQDVDAVAARRMKPVELVGSFGIGFHGRAKVIKIRLGNRKRK